VYIADVIAFFFSGRFSRMCWIPSLTVEIISSVMVCVRHSRGFGLPPSRLVETFVGIKTHSPVYRAHNRVRVAAAAKRAIEVQRAQFRKIAARRHAAIANGDREAAAQSPDALVDYIQPSTRATIG
jgi:hypothetical protein